MVGQVGGGLAWYDSSPAGLVTTTVSLAPGAALPEGPVTSGERPWWHLINLDFGMSYSQLPLVLAMRMPVLFPLDVCGGL